MSNEVAKRLVLSNAATVYSPNVEMTGANAVFGEIVSVRLPSGGVIRCQTQQGNDGENWSDVGSVASFSSIGPTTLKVTGIGARWVRFAFVSTGASGQSLVGLSVETKNL